MSLDRFPIPSPNVPLIHLPRLQTSNSWSFIGNDKSSDYFTSKSYLIDALNISSRIPITYARPISCLIDDNYRNRRKKDELQINLKRIKQILYGNHFQLNQKYPCKKQHTYFDNKSKQNQSIPLKKPHHISQKQILPEKHQHNPSISSQPTISLSPTNIKVPINTPRNITSHTRFGKSMLALYFQKYRFISPIDNNKKDEFLQLLKAFR